MNTLRTRTNRLTAACVLALGLGVLGTGPALADGTASASSTSPESFTHSADEDASPDSGCLYIGGRCWFI